MRKYCQRFAKISEFNFENFMSQCFWQRDQMCDKAGKLVGQEFRYVRVTECKYYILEEET